MSATLKDLMDHVEAHRGALCISFTGEDWAVEYVWSSPKPDDKFYGEVGTSEATGQAQTLDLAMDLMMTEVPDL